MTAPLPGMEDVDAPPELCGIAYAEWKVGNYPSCLAVLRALLTLAGTGRHVLHCNEAIHAEVNRIRPMGMRTMENSLKNLQTVHRLIERGVARGPRSRRKITFTFDPSEKPDKRRGGANDLRPWAQTTCALRFRKSRHRPCLRKRLPPL